MASSVGQPAFFRPGDRVYSKKHDVHGEVFLADPHGYCIIPDDPLAKAVWCVIDDLWRPIDTEKQNAKADDDMCDVSLDALHDLTHGYGHMTPGASPAERSHDAINAEDETAWREKFGSTSGDSDDDDD